MVKQRMDLLELLRKRGMDGDVDLLREALRVLVDGIMDAEVSAQIRRSARRTQPRAGHLPQRLPQPHLGYPGGHHGVAHSQAAGRQLLPQPAGTAAAQRESPAGRHPASLCRRRVHPAGGRSDPGPGVATASPAARCRASASNWTKWWRVSWVGPWTVVPTPTCGWTA